MPIYEYECEACHHKFDLMQKMSDEPVKKCPECSLNKVIRLVSAAGFQLKGTGWYATDFKHKGTAAEATANKAGSEKTAEKTQAKTESKKVDSE